MPTASNANKESASRIWRYAESFNAAAETLAKAAEGRINDKKGPPDDWRPFVPMATIDLFAAELYFKTLHRLEFGKDARGHDYQKLYETLPPGTREAIREMHKARLKRQNVVGMSVGARRLTNFDACLQHSSKVFEKVRYLYEEPPDQIFYWPLLKHSLRDTIFGICPEWRMMGPDAVGFTNPS